MFSISGESKLRIREKHFLAKYNSGRDRTTKHQEDHKNIIYYQYISLLFSLAKQLVCGWFTFRVRKIIFTYCRILAKINVTFDRRFIVFSAFEHAPQCIFEPSDRQRRQVFNTHWNYVQLFCNSINIFMISTHNTFNPFAKSYFHERYPQGQWLANIENRDFNLLASKFFLWISPQNLTEVCFICIDETVASYSNECQQQQLLIH